MKPHLTCLLWMHIILWPIQAQAQEKKTSADSLMRQIYAASSGHFRGEAHFRQDGETPNWHTSAHEVICSQQADFVGDCEGVTGDDEWRVSYRYNGGMVYVGAESGGERWTMQYRIVDPWFSDPDNFGYKRKWTSVIGGIEYQGIDEFVQMGSRTIIIRNIKPEGTDNDYSYVLFEYLDRVE